MKFHKGLECDDGCIVILDVDCVIKIVAVFLGFRSYLVVSNIYLMLSAREEIVDSESDWSEAESTLELC